MSGYGYGKKKRSFWSTSGWEHSHYGGFSRIIWDYPYIKMGHEGRIESDPELRKKEGIYTAEKLVKIYVMKCKEYGLIHHLTMERITKPNIIGRETEFDVLKLDRADVLAEVMSKSKEFAPLFEHFKDAILNSTIEIEVPEDEEVKVEGKVKKVKAKKTRAKVKKDKARVKARVKAREKTMVMVKARLNQKPALEDGDRLVQTSVRLNNLSKEWRNSNHLQNGVV